MDPSKLNIPANIANEFETKKVEFQKLSAEVRKLVNSQQQFEAQYHENAMVKEELDGHSADEPIYKLFGNILIHQDHDSVQALVKSRLDLIKSELEKTAKLIKEKQEKQLEVRKRLGEIQSLIQAQVQQGGASA